MFEVLKIFVEDCFEQKFCFDKNSYEESEHDTGNFISYVNYLLIVDSNCCLKKGVFKKIFCSECFAWKVKFEEHTEKGRFECKGRKSI